MLGVGMFGFSLFASGEKIDIRLFFKKLWPFLPGGLLAAGYLFYHWMETGWVGYHENSTWAPSFERVDFQGFVKNIGILVWRLLDFGRVFIWGVLVIFIWVCWKKLNWRISKPDRRQTGWQLAALSAIIFLALGPSQLFYQGLLAHRYFLPFFLSLNFLILYLIKGRGSLQLEERWRKLAASVLCLGLATGNFWVYPQKIAMGWDSTLAHLPWNGLQNQVQDYLNNAAIPYNKVGTAFPNIGPRELHELNGVSEGFVEKDLPTNCYVFYSNIMNDFTDAEIDELQQRWVVVFERQVGAVCTILYQNPNLTGCEN